MTDEDRIKRLEKIVLALEHCIPESRYAKEYGISPEDVIEAKQLLSEIRNEDDHECCFWDKEERRCTCGHSHCPDSYECCDFD